MKIILQFHVDRFKNSKTVSKEHLYSIKHELIYLEFHIVEELPDEKCFFPIRDGMKKLKFYTLFKMDDTP